MTDIEYLEWRIRYEDQAHLVEIPVPRIKSILAEVKRAHEEIERLNRIVAAYREQETLPLAIGGES